MKVRELIERLQAFDPDMEVTTASHEYGLIALETLGQVPVIAMVPNEFSSSVYRLALAQRTDARDQTIVVCCGPLDPSLIP